jgi:rhodanese-related sulfurtransferase
VSFFIDPANLILLAVALVSGGLLLWPLLQPDAGIPVSAATLLINRRNAVIVDVRATDEFASGHLPQAKHFALEELSGKVAQINKNKKTPVLLVCQTGRGARKAKALLASAGYAEIAVLRGGMNAWRQAGMPIVKERSA